MPSLKTNLPENDHRDPWLANAPWILAALFFLSRLPVCFFAHHWEELRDFDAFLQVAQGHLPYRDYYWHYGPLTPLVYGLLLKLLPPTLLSVRLISLVICSVGVGFLARLLTRYFPSRPAVYFGTVLTSSVLFYPNYSHNHMTTAVGLIALANYGLRFIDERSPIVLWQSFLALLVVVLSRPILTGYAAAFAFLLLMLILLPARAWGRTILLIGGTKIFIAALLFLIYGTAILHGFFPRSIAVYPPSGYPNLHFLLPAREPGIGLALASIKGLRASLDTVLFYLQFFLWPTVLVTLLFLGAPSRRLIAALVCLGLAICGGFDVLHYGNSNPIANPMMYGRGQYFAMLTLLSIFLVVYPEASAAQSSWRKRLAQLGLAVLLLWGYLPYGAGLYTWLQATINPYDFPALRGVAVPPTESATYGAVAFINQNCRTGDKIMVGYYQGGLNRLLRCEDIFKNDSALMDCPGGGIIKPGESPYGPDQTETVAELITARRRATSPRFILGIAGTFQLEDCKAPEWHWKDFAADGSRRVCWKD